MSSNTHCGDTVLAGWADKFDLTLERIPPYYQLRRRSDGGYERNAEGSTIMFKTDVIERLEALDAEGVQR